MIAVESSIFYGVLAFMIAESLWEFYLSFRQHQIYKTVVKVPSELKGIITEETFEKARLYALDRSSFSFVKESFGAVISVILLSVNGYMHFWNLSGYTLRFLGYTNYGELLQTAMLTFVLNIYSVVLSLPFGVYKTFVLEEKHGFNKQTPGFFIKDQIKSFILTQVITIPLSVAVSYIILIGGDYFFIYLWVFVMIITFVLMTIYPNVIAPLFDKYTPLPDGSLKTRIEELAKSIDFPLYKLYVVEGSKRSTHSNAYFYGFFKNKRIVLFDTLLKDFVFEDGEAKDKTTEKDEKEVKEKQENKDDSDTADEKDKLISDEKKDEEEKKGCSDDEVLAVLGHELGHWKLNHVLKNIVLMQVNLFLLFMIFAALSKYDALYRAFGFYNERPVCMGLLIVLQFIFAPYHAVVSFFLTMLSRSFEFQADAFARGLGKAHFLRQALIKLEKDNLGFPVYDWLYSMWEHSHPPLLERLKALDDKSD